MEEDAQCPEPAPALHTGLCSLSREALLARHLGECPRCGWEGAPLPPPSSWTWGGYMKVSGSSPPIGQFSKSAFKFPFVSRRGGLEELFLFKFFSLYVDTKRKFSTGHVRM